MRTFDRYVLGILATKAKGDLSELEPQELERIVDEAEELAKVVCASIGHELRLSMLPETGRLAEATHEIPNVQPGCTWESDRKWAGAWICQRCGATEKELREP